MDFVHSRLKNMHYDKPFCKGVSVVEKAKAVDVRTLFTLVANGDPVPSMKSYNFMPASQIDLNQPVKVIDSHAKLVDTAKAHMDYLDKKAQYDKDVSEENERLAKEEEKARIIAEHEASKVVDTSVTEGAQ